MIWKGSMCNVFRSSMCQVTVFWDPAMVALAMQELFGLMMNGEE
jgi:hypothetical protein